MRPAAARYADAAAQHQHVDGAAVDHVLVVPVIHAGANDDHRAAARLFRGVREFARDRDEPLRGNAGDRLLPFRRVRDVVVIRFRAGVAEAAVDAVVRAQQVVHGGNDDVALDGGEPLDRYGALEHVPALVVAGEARVRRAAEVGKRDGQHVVPALEQRQRESHVAAGGAVLLLEIPFAEVGLDVRAPAVADRSLRCDGSARNLVEPDDFPFGAVALPERVREIRGAQIAVGNVAVARLDEANEHRQVGVAALVILEVRHLPVDVELLQDHVTHRHRHRGVGALLRMQPHVAETRDLGIIGRDRAHLRPVVTRLDHEMRVGRARLRHVRAPRDDVLRVVPVGRFRDVGLLAPRLGRRRRQVAVPVVERQHAAADEREVARAGRMRDHRHRGDGRKPADAIGTVCHDRMDVGRGDDLRGLVPCDADEAAAAANRLVVARLVRILDDGRPRRDRVQRLPGLAPQAHQTSAHHRVLQPIRAIEIPAVRGAAGAAARLVVRLVRSGARVVGLLRFPRHDAALDIDFPAAATRAIDAMRRAHDLVVLPARPVAFLPTAILAARLAMTARERLSMLGEKREAVEEMAHEGPWMKDRIGAKVTVKRVAASRQAMRGRTSARRVKPGAPFALR